MNRKILVLDTTLRDGEQSPGAKLNLKEKMQIACQLKNLNIDILEAGFPASSKGDFEAVKSIASKFKNDFTITALARAVKNDIFSVYESLNPSLNPMIHIVLGTSNIHLDKKFNKSKEDIMNIGIESVKYAKTLFPNVQYSTEDASRSEFEYLWDTIKGVINAGATIINIPDTVGYAVPEEFGELIKNINYRIKNTNPSVLLSVHCHNDTGLATANTLAAIKNGADKIECTINGLGERAGNTALEEVIMAMKLREDYYKATTNIVTKEIIKTSRLVSSLTGLDVQVNKAVTGENAFAHSSGIHQDGLLKSRRVYEVLDPKDIGLNNMEMVLTARSGRHAFKNSLEKFSLNCENSEDFEMLFQEFIKIADNKKEVYDHDIYNIIINYSKGSNKIIDLYTLESFNVVSSSISPKADIALRKGDSIYTGTSNGSGPIDALFTAIKEVANMDLTLNEYKINSVSSGKEAFGRVSVRLSCNNKEFLGRAVEKDIIKASANAFINAINSLLLSDLKKEV